MALPQIVAQRRARALNRLAVIQGVWAGSGVSSEQQPITGRDAEIASVQQLENLANLTEAMDQKVELIVSALPSVEGVTREANEHSLAYLARYAANGASSPPADPLEDAATYISSNFGMARQSDETAAEFLERVKPSLAPRQEKVTSNEPPSLPAEVMATLAAKGFDTPEKIAAASDADLKGQGIGTATVTKIRAAYPPKV